MATIISTSHAKQYLNQQVTIRGFVHSLRDQGKIKFLILRDRHGFLQIVILPSHPQAFSSATNLPEESVISVTGLLKSSPQAPQGIEIEAEEITILSQADPNLPIPIVAQKGADKTTLSKRLDWRWLDLRKPDNLLIFKVWTALEAGFRQTLLSAGFLQIYTPSLMNTASESGAEVFEVKYFDRSAYLAQSPQFYKQMAIAAGFEKVFMVGPVFRAEPSFTTRHLTEFTGWDFEFAYPQSHHDIMDLEEQVLISAFKTIKDNLHLDIDIPSSPFPRLPLLAVKKRLAKLGVPSHKPDDLSPEEERQLSQMIKQETGSDFVFVIDYPVSARPFYHMRHADNPSLTKSFDLLYKGLEITTGAQREHRYDILVAQAKEKNLPLKPLTNYLNFFKYGCPPHGGAGLGPARIVMQILGLNSVKEATFLPRDVRRLTP